jgi:hypothetical protein
MKRRIAHKVVNAMIAGTSRHRADTRRRALALVLRDFASGRLDGLTLARFAEWSWIVRPWRWSDLGKIPPSILKILARLEAGGLVLKGGPDWDLIAELEAYPPD